MVQKMEHFEHMHEELLMNGTLHLLLKIQKLEALLKQQAFSLRLRKAQREGQEITPEVLLALFAGMLWNKQLQIVTPAEIQGAEINLVAVVFKALFFLFLKQFPKGLHSAL